jgi:urea transport system substrate-binding protein
MSKEGGGAKRWVLLGTDYVYPRTTNKILRAFLKSKGVDEKDIDEKYTPFGHSDYQTIVADIKKFAAGGKTAVVSTINGDSNVPFYKELGNQGLKATDVPVVAFSVGEEELRGVDTKPLVGHLAAWNYFMSIKNPVNDAWKKKWADYAKKNKLPGADKPHHQRSDGSHLRRHVDVEAGGREGQVHRHRQGRRRDGRPVVPEPERLHDEDGQHQPSPVEAGVHRRDPVQRPVQDRVEGSKGLVQAQAVEPVHRGNEGKKDAPEKKL